MSHVCCAVTAAKPLASTACDNADFGTNPDPDPDPGSHPNSDRDWDPDGDAGPNPGPGTDPDADSDSTDDNESDAEAKTNCEAHDVEAAHEAQPGASCGAAHEAGDR